MKQDWTKKEAAKAAEKKCEQARALLQEAKEIFHSIDHDVDKANVGEAIVYVDEVIS